MRQRERRRTRQMRHGQVSTPHRRPLRVTDRGKNLAGDLIIAKGIALTQVSLSAASSKRWWVPNEAISTVFGNAALAETAPVMRALGHEPGSRADRRCLRLFAPPGHFRCARVSGWAGDDPLLLWFGGGPALLVAQADGLPASTAAAAEAVHHDVVSAKLDELLR